MNSRYFAGRIFLVLAIVLALVGTVLFHRSEIGTGLTGEDYLNPSFWITIPRLIPLAASLVSACFGLVYFGIEKKSQRPLSIPITIIHLVAYLLAILGHATMVNFWWRVLNEPQPANTPLPLWASLLELVGFATCCLAFILNILWSSSRTRRVSENPT